MRPGSKYADEDLGAFAAGYVVDLFAIGHGGEGRGRAAVGWVRRSR